MMCAGTSAGKFARNAAGPQDRWAAALLVSLAGNDIRVPFLRAMINAKKALPSVASNQVHCGGKPRTSGKRRANEAKALWKAALNLSTRSSFPRALGIGRLLHNITTLLVVKHHEKTAQRQRAGEALGPPS